MNLQASHSGFAAGDYAVWPGQGLVVVEGAREIDGKHLMVVKVVGDGHTITVPRDKLSSVMRRPIDRPEAERLIAMLRQQSGAPDNRPWAERFHDYMVVLVKRPLEVQVGVLHTLYRTPYAPTFGEKRLIYQFERVVVGELAHVLGKDLDSVMLPEVRKGHPAFEPNQPARPPDPKLPEPKAPVPLKHHVYLGSFSAPSGRIIVGESTAPTKDTFLAQGKPGEWHAYIREAEHDDDEGGLVLLHADVLGQYAKLSEHLSDVTTLNVEGGTIAMVGAEVHDDEKFREAMLFPVDPIVQGRGCQVTTNGDGEHHLRGAKIADQFVVLRVDY